MPSVPTSRATRVTSRGECIELIHHRVDGVLQFENFAARFHGDFAGQVAARHGGGDIGDVADLRRQIARHRVDAFGQFLPDAADAAHIRLAAQLSFCAHLAGDASYFAAERIELVHHRVDGVLQLQHLAAHIHGDLLGKIAAGHRGGDVRNVAHLCGEITGHRVDALSEISPHAAHSAHIRLAAEFALGPDLSGNAGHFSGERVQLVHHDVDGVLQFLKFAARIDSDLRRQIAVRNRRGDFGNVANLIREVRRHEVHALGEFAPDPAPPFTSAWPPSLPSVPTSRAMRVTSRANELNWSTIVLMVLFSS